jgi:bacterioferritin-associated ferredoxin
MLAAAELLASEYEGRQLKDLHALADEPLSLLCARLGAFPGGRQHCIETVISALKDAFFDLRRRQVEEYTGEKALLCTCFGITVETVETYAKQGADTVGRVGELCRAGTGCGSCQMLIQEIIDAESATR